MSLQLGFCSGGIEQGIDPYQLMKIGCWKSADVFFNHYVASQPPSCVPIVIIPAAPSDIPPNSSDSSVLPAVPAPVFTRAAALLDSEQFLVDGSICIPDYLLSIDYDSFNPWDDTQAVLDATLPTAAFNPLPSAGSSSVIPEFISDDSVVLLLMLRVTNIDKQ